MTLLAGFQTLLHRYSAQDDFAIGIPIAGRNRRETEDLIGFFLNTLVLRAEFTGNPSFRELLARTQKVCLAAYAHQDLPFEKLVEELHPERDLSRNPLFQTTFAFQNTPRFLLELAGLTANELEVDTGIARFDLHLFMEEKEKRLRGYLDYDTDLFNSETITRMLGHFQTLLESIVANPEQRLSDLPMLTDAERQQLLVEWNDTATEYPEDKCIHQLFEAQVERTPDAAAVIFEDNQLTYRELNCRANQLAHHLKGLGVGPEVLVGICMERSLEMIVALLGILKAGAAYVPLDPTYPKDRLAFMLEDTQIPVLLTQERLMTNVPIQNPKSGIQNPVVVCLDTDWEAIARESRQNPASEMTASNLAYVIYTSGSTGRPKGAQIIHDSLLNLVFWHQRAFAVTAADRATQLAGPGFDAAVWELWPYLTAGASVHLSDEANRITPESLRDWLVTQGITVCFLPTVLTEGILALEWPPETALRVL